MSGSWYPATEMNSIGFQMTPGLPNAKPSTRRAFYSAATENGYMN